MVAGGSNVIGELCVEVPRYFVRDLILAFE